MRILVSVLLIAFTLVLRAQVFDSESIQQLIKKGTDHIYNANADSSRYYIAKVEKMIPNHPVIPLMRAMTILWSNIPIISEEEFSKMDTHLNKAIELSEAQDSELENPEMIFFALASYGLLAEYYADQGYTISAVSKASRAYVLMKKGFEIVDEHPEFLLTTGLYNYFREKYPMKHPIYKPLLWFFRNGDMELGLKQLKKACDDSFLTTVEAHIYLSYIYLRYEYKPKLAQHYLSVLCFKYPNNFYAKAKYIESFANTEDFKNAPTEIIYSLIAHKNPYYKLAGYVFLGYFEEKITGNQRKAEYAYRKGLGFGKVIPDHGEFFKGFGYLGLGRILLKKKEKEEAEELLDLALSYAETEQVKDEVKKLLAQF